MQSFKKKHELVSVIISTHNYGKFIVEALNSLKQQTYPRIEVIIIDDYSTDDTEQIVQNWRSSHRNDFENFIYLKTPRNIYSSFALNIGFYMARGEYIVIHDADDISDRRKIKMQVNFLKQNKDFDAVGSRFYTFRDNISHKLWPAAWLSYDAKEIESNYMQKEVKHCVAFGTLLFRSSIIDKVIGCKRVLGEANDIFFLTDIVRNGFKVGNLNEILFYVRLHSERSKPHYQESIKNKQNNFKRMKEKVSIVLPVKRNSDRIIHALESLSLQTYDNIEIIIVDDCTDTITEKMITEWYNSYRQNNPIGIINELLYFKLPIEIGEPWLYNIGAYLSKGEYIVFHGDNDTSTCDKIQQQVNFLKDNPTYSAVGTNFNGGSPDIHYGVSIKHKYIVEGKPCVNVKTLMLRSNVIDEVAGIAKCTFGKSDFSFIYRLIYDGYLIENLKDVLYYNKGVGLGV